MFTAINAWTFEASMPPAELVSAASNAGFDAIELVVNGDGTLRPDTPLDECRDIARLAHECGISICGLATGQFWQRNYASPDAADRQAAHDLTIRTLDRAAALDAGAILVVPAVVGRAAERRPTVSYADALNRSIDALCRLRPEAEERGVAIAIENVWNRFLLSPLEMADLIDRVNSPHVGVYLDIGNVLPYGYPADWIATLGHRVRRVHVKDYDLSQPGPAGFCPLGEGDVDWRGVVAALHAINYAGPLTYEGDGDPPEINRRLRRILDGKSALTTGGAP